MWKGHDASVLSIREWGADKLITYYSVRSGLTLDMDGMGRYLYGSLAKRKRVFWSVDCLLMAECGESLGYCILWMSRK